MVNIPNQLRLALRDGKVIPFAGAGVSRAVECVGKDGAPTQNLFPSWSELLDELAKELDEAQNPNEANAVRVLLRLTVPDYLYAAEIAKQWLPGNAWLQSLKSRLDPYRSQAVDESLALGRALWGLGSKMMITTNYDRVLQWACPDADNLDIWNIEHTAEMAQFLQTPLTRPVIWHLHGHISDVENLILTPNGYSMLYSSGDGSVPPSYNVALETLKNTLASYTFLFVGFSFADEAFGDQLQWVTDTFRGYGGNHFALVHKDHYASLARRLSDYSISPVPFDDFGEPLVELIRELGEIAILADTDNERSALIASEGLQQLRISAPAHVISSILPVISTELQNFNEVAKVEIQQAGEDNDNS